MRSSAVTARATDASGRALPVLVERVHDARRHEAGLFASKRWDGEEALLAFRAPPGTWRVEAEFELGGRSWFGREDVVVVRDRAGDAAYVLPFPCASLQRTERGAWVCAHRIVRGQQLVQELREGAVTAVAGDVVWEIARGLVVRHVDTGAGPLAVSAAGSVVHLDTGRVAAVATEDSLFVTDGLEVVRYGVGPEAGAVRAVREVPSRVASGTRSLLLSGSRLYECGSDGLTTECCALLAGGGGLEPTGAKCARLPGLQFGVAQGSVWTFDRENTVRFWNPSGDGLAEAARATLPRAYQPTRPLVAWLQCWLSAWVVPVAASGEITWERFRKQGSAELKQQGWPAAAAASDRYAWEILEGADGSTTHIYAR